MNLRVDIALAVPVPRSSSSCPSPAGNWPSNTNLGLCYDKRCPGNADVAAAVEEVRKGKDIIKVAQEFRHVNYGRLTKGLGPRGGPKAAKAAKAAKEL